MSRHTPSPEPVNSRRYAGLDHEARVAKRREQFIAAGRQLFGTQGYRKTTVRALCKEAGLTDRYFYESFEHLEDLLIAVYSDVIGRMQQALLKAFVSTATQDIDKIIDASVDAFFQEVENPIHARIVWLEVLGVSVRVDAIYNQATRNFADLLLMLTRSSLPNVDISSSVTRVVAMAAIGAMSETAKDWLMRGYQEPRQDLVSGSCLVLKGIMNSLR